MWWLLIVPSLLASLIKRAVDSQNLVNVSDLLDKANESEMNQLADILLNNFSESFVTSILQTNVNGFAHILIKKAASLGNKKAVEIGLKHSTSPVDPSLASDPSYCTDCQLCSDTTHKQRSVKCEKCSITLCSECTSNTLASDFCGCPFCRADPWTQSEIPPDEAKLFRAIESKFDSYSYTKLSEEVGKLYAYTLDFTQLFRLACNSLNNPHSKRSFTDLKKSKLLLILKRNGANVNYDDAECLRDALSSVQNSSPTEFPEYLITQVGLKFELALKYSDTPIEHQLKLVQLLSQLESQRNFTDQTKILFLTHGTPAEGDDIHTLITKREIRQTLLPMNIEEISTDSFFQLSNKRLTALKNNCSYTGTYDETGLCLLSNEQQLLVNAIHWLINENDPEITEDSLQFPVRELRVEPGAQINMSMEEFLELYIRQLNINQSIPVTNNTPSEPSHLSQPSQLPPEIREKPEEAVETELTKEEPQTSKMSNKTTGVISLSLLGVFILFLVIGKLVKSTRHQ
jgi:hypothetical protein